jgi:hypothetical protein
MKVLRFLFLTLADELRKVIRREIRRDIERSLVTHAEARQSLDLYEMKLETLDTRLAKRLMALEGRVAELEIRGEMRPARRVA